MEGVKKIVSKRETELIAKRRAIEEAMRYWDDEQKEYFVELEVSWLPSVPEPKRVTETIVARREIVSQYLKREALQYWREKNGSLYLKRYEYFELWDLLKQNQDPPKKKDMFSFVRELFNDKKKSNE